MKKIYLESVKFLEVEQKGEDVLVSVGKSTMKMIGDKFIERVKKEMPFIKVRELSDKYEKDADGKISDPEQAEEYIEGLNKLQEEYMEENELQIYYGDDLLNLSDLVNDILEL